MKKIQILCPDRVGILKSSCLSGPEHFNFQLVPRGPFLERPSNLMGPESDFDIRVSRKVGRVLTSDEVHFVSLADNLTVQFSNLLKLPLEWKTKQLNGPGNYRGLRETGPWSLKYYLPYRCTMYCTLFY